MIKIKMYPIGMDEVASNYDDMLARIKHVKKIKAIEEERKMNKYGLKVIDMKELIEIINDKMERDKTFEKKKSVWTELLKDKGLLDKETPENFEIFEDENTTYIKVDKKDGYEGFKNE